MLRGDARIACGPEMASSSALEQQIGSYSDDVSSAVMEVLRT
jgi:hypothetical protein